MLNKQGPGKIDYCDFSFNIISGKCQNNCPYCYMIPMWTRFPELAKVKFKEHYLDVKLPKKPCKIFIGSSTDMWGTWISSKWIQKVLDFVENNPQHIFQFLTKNPKRYYDFNLPDNGWYGTTVDGTFKTFDNLFHLTHSAQGQLKFISFEPLIESPMISSAFSKIDWIIIGADSSKGAKKPPFKWADFLMREAKENNIPVWIKDNYKYPKTIKEFPL